jgi:hypothetical protein
MTRAMTHNVYVVRLDASVLEQKDFQELNPNYEPGKPCVYVGMTGLSPDDRFRNHKSGYKASRKVKRFGRYLMRKQFERLNPMPFEDACEMERALAERLRRKGYGVWQN